MTSVYARPETQKLQFEQALRLWPASLTLAERWERNLADCEVARGDRDLYFGEPDEAHERW